MAGEQIVEELFPGRRALVRVIIINDRAFVPVTEPGRLSKVNASAAEQVAGVPQERSRGSTRVERNGREAAENLHLFI